MDIRRFSVVLLVFLLLGSPAAIWAQEEEPVEITFVLWKPHQPEAWDRLMEEFHEQHPGIRVKREIGPSSATQFHSLLVTKLRAKGEIDLFLLDVIWPTEFARAGYLDPVDDLVPPEKRGEFFPGTIEANTVDGKLMAVPFNIDAGVLYYRRDLLEKYGFSPPQTWSELVRQAKTIMEGEGNPALLGHAGQFDRYEGLICNMLEFIGSRGGRMVSERGEPDLGGAQTQEAIHFVRTDLIEGIARRAALNMKEPESRSVFARGEAVFLRNWPETWNIVNDPEKSAVAGKVGLTVLPKFEGGEHAATLGGWQVGIASHSKQKEAARTFAKFLTSRETLVRLCLQTGQTMSRISVIEDPRVTGKFPHFTELKSVLQAAIPRPKLVNYAEVSDRLQGDLYRAISGGREEVTTGRTWFFVAITAVPLLILVVILASRSKKG